MILQARQSEKTSSALTVFGWACLLPTALFSLRMVYEETVLTWRDGWQALGFSLIHSNPGLLIVGALGAGCAHLFLLLLLGRIIVAKIKGRPFPRSNILQVLALSFFLGLLYVPYEEWITLIVIAKGPGQNGSSYLSVAAAENHPYLAKVLIDRGVPVDSLFIGHTALNGACVVKDAPMARYLISRGADVNRAPDCKKLETLP